MIKTFDTSIYFSGGAGMFISYHDVVKPVKLYMILKMLITGEDLGFPTKLLSNMSPRSIIEWYVNRRYINPLKCLDFKNQLSDDEIDKLQQKLLDQDDSIYRISPSMNIKRMLDSYSKQHMSFPVYVYSENYEKHIESDIKKTFSGVNVTYVHGDLESAIKKGVQNFTYIFSDIELMKDAFRILHGTCSHVLLAGDYRYNYSGYRDKTKYDLKELAVQHPIIRPTMFQVLDYDRLERSIINLNLKSL